MWSRAACLILVAVGGSVNVSGAFVGGSIEETPTRVAYRRSFVYKGQEVDARLEVQSPSGLCDPNVKQFSGYFSFGPQKQYFFWLLESRRDPLQDPTVMWLTGGPGCSSMTGLLFENGPCKVDASGETTSLNPFSWTTRANVMWVDQPPGTGFSKGSYDHDEDGVAEDMYQFLQVFFQALPQYSKSFWVTGESYAGHYVPAVTSRIVSGNRDLAPGDVEIPLKGLAVGNGLTDPVEQYKWYPDMMCKGGGHAPPVITSPTACQALYSAVPTCEAALESCNAKGPVVNATACVMAYQLCNIAFQVPYASTGMNPYDQRVKCQVRPLCYNVSMDVKFLNDKDVQRQLGVDMPFQSCNMDVHRLFMVDFVRNFHELIPPMLDAGIEVLIYAGDQDFICNWLGNEKWTLGLDWAHKKEFNAAGTRPFVVSGKDVGAKDGQEVGELRTYGNFHFLRVYQAGHMVPLDQPEAALGMLNAFMDGTLGKEPSKTGTELVI